jgi:hypothetical protein
MAHSYQVMWAGFEPIVLRFLVHDFVDAVSHQREVKGNEFLGLAASEPHAQLQCSSSLPLS